MISSWLLSIVCLIITFRPAVSSAYKILTIGDSWAAGATKSIVETLCPGSTALNLGQGGTTAEQWANKDLDAEFPDDDFDPDYIYLSIGGNDYIKKLLSCEPNGGHTQVAAWITTVINNLNAKYGIKPILLAGYGVPITERVYYVGCKSLDVWTELHKVYNDHTYPSNTNVIHVEELFGGGIANGVFSPSSSNLYRDSIHLNNAGYQVFFTYGPISNFFGGICTGSFPTPSPTPCFSCQSTVQVLDKGHVLLKNVAPGDKILTASHTYQTVYAFAHRQEDVEATFLQVMATPSWKNAPLEVTGDHFLYVLADDKNQRRVVRADSLRVGDKLLTKVQSANDMQNNTTATVTSIRTIRRKGIYSVLTKDGTAVIDGIVTSNYVTLPGQSTRDDFVRVGGVAIPFLTQAAAIHIALCPLRMWCLLTRSQSSACQVEENNGGVTSYMAWASTLYLWAIQKSVFFQWTAAFFFLILIIPAAVVEALFFNRSTVIAASIFTAAVIAVSMKPSIARRLSLQPVVSSGRIGRFGN